MKKTVKKWAAGIAALLFWILVWHFAAKKVELSIILPSPAEVFSRLIYLARTTRFYKILGASLLRICTGFASGVLAGAALGFLAYRFSFFRILIRPLMVTVRATPVASFTLVVWLWLARDSVPGFISFLMVLPIVWQNTILGFEKRDPLLGEMAKVYSFGKAKTFLRVDLPQVAPYVISASKTSLGLAWKAGVAAEVLATPAVSIGTMIHDAKNIFETVDLYAWTLAIIIISVVLEKLMTLLLSLKGGKKNAHHS